MTRLLCLDTTAAHCAVALIDGKKVLSSNKEPMTKGQAERLFPMIDETLQTAGITFKNLDAADIAAELGAAASSEQMPAPEIYGFIAQTKDWTSEPRPAPLYLRSPDAALPSEPAPHIIP